MTKINSKTLQIFTQNLREKSIQHVRNINADIKFDMEISDAIRNINRIKIFYVESKDFLGKYDDKQDIILLNKSLAYMPFEEAVDILLHEIAHKVHHRYNSSSDHSKEFKKLCDKIGCCGDAIYKASSTISSDTIFFVNKVKKLMALSSSSNINESELALARANQLIQKYNLSMIDNIHEDDTELIEIKVDTVNRKTTKVKILMDIMSKFSVYVLYSEIKKYHVNKRPTKIIDLLIVGSKANVEIAEYVYNYLNNELDRLYKDSGLKGAGAKPSFMIGFRKEFINKNHTIQTETMTEDETTALVQYKDDIDLKAVELFYSNDKLTCTRRSTYHYNSNAHSAGSEAGKRTTVNPSIRNKSNILALA